MKTIMKNIFNINDGKLFEISNEILPSFYDKVLSLPVIFTAIVIFQGCFGGFGMGQTPAVITNMGNSPFARVFFITCIAYTATSDLETALFTTVLFLIIMHLLRTKEEKEQLKYYV